MLGLKYCLGFYIGIWIKVCWKNGKFFLWVILERGEGWGLVGEYYFKCYRGILFYNICINLIDIYFINYSECLVIIW